MCVCVTLCFSCMGATFSGRKHRENKSLFFLFFAFSYVFICNKVEKTKILLLFCSNDFLINFKRLARQILNYPGMGWSLNYPENTSVKLLNLVMSKNTEKSQNCILPKFGRNHPIVALKENNSFRENSSNYNIKVPNNKFQMYLPL